MPTDRRERRERRPVPPLDTAALERLALRYVERFATTRGKLVDYLMRKVRERGWDGEAADPHGLAERLAGLGYIDDRLFAETKAASMARRGLGARRIAGVFREARIEDDDVEAVAPAIADRAVEAALAFARRRRIGPYGDGSGDRTVREKQLGAMIRAGHGFDLARRIVAAAPADAPDPSDYD